MKILNFLKPPPVIQEIEDEGLVKKNYRYWRWRMFYGMYVGYVFYYFSRKSFTFAMPAMMKDLGFDKSDLGILASILSIAYGASKFLSGIISDRSNPRYFMAVGLICTGILNIFFGLSSSIFFFALFWGLNGYFQGFGWPPCARLLTHWYSQKERGTWWGFCSSSHNLGGALIPLVAAFCAQYWGWRYAMYVPGALCIAAGLFLINRLRDTPQSLGLPSIEKFNNDYPEESGANDNSLSAKQILFQYVLKNKFIWVLALSYFFVYAVRMAVNDWGALYLVETKGYNLLTAGSCIFWFEIGGLFGSLSAGWASDKFYNGRRGPINVLFCIAVIGAVFALWMVPAGMVLLDSIAMFAVGFFIFGPQMLIGMAASELAGKNAAGSANGFVGLTAYLGAAFAGYPLGKICQEYGWNGFFLAVGVCGILSILLLLPLWRVGASRKSSKPIAAPEEAEVLVPTEKS